MDPTEANDPALAFDSVDSEAIDLVPASSLPFRDQETGAVFADSVDS